MCNISQRKINNNNFCKQKDQSHKLLLNMTGLSLFIIVLKFFYFTLLILHKFIKRYPIHLRQLVRNIKSQHTITVLV